MSSTIKALWLLNLIVAVGVIDIRQDEINYFTYTKTIPCVDHRLKVRGTYFKLNSDQLFSTKQTLFLEVSDSVIEIVNPASRKSKITHNKKIVKVVSTMIQEVKCIKSKKSNETAYLLYGCYNSYTSDSPHEFFGVLSSSGRWVWYYYGSSKEKYRDYGDHKNLLSDYGQEIENLTNMISVVPE